MQPSLHSVGLLLCGIVLLVLIVGSGSDYSNCSTEIEAINSTYNALQNAYVACGCGVNPCIAVAVIDYDLGLHVAAIFIVLIASVLGSATPIIAKNNKRLSISPFLIILGKCMGIGVVLACALVHMIQPSNQSLTSVCVPWEFNTDYQAYAYLFAMLAALGMQFVDFLVLQYMKSIFEEDKAKKGVTVSDADKQGQPADLEMAHQHAEHNHVHSVLLAPGMEKRLSAYMLEFAVAVHSLFIGLENGVVDAETLRTLLVALCFHQFFEGVALGARIADADLPSHFHEIGLASIFSIAAPFGIAVGVLVTSTLNPSGQTFLLIQGTFDGVCGGIMLYIGFILLLVDFPEDMKLYCKNNNYKKAGMFASLWVGAGLMAFIGKYL